MDVLLLGTLILACFVYMFAGKRTGLRLSLVPLVCVLVVLCLWRMALYSTGDFTEQQAREHGERIFGTPTAVSSNEYGEDY